MKTKYAEKSERLKMAKRKDYSTIIGKKFGRLTLLSVSNTKNERGSYLLNLLCECGKLTQASFYLLTRNKKQSCGCLRKEFATSFGRRLSPRVSKDFLTCSINTLYSRYKNSAKRNDRPFTLMKRAFRELVQSNCFYCDEKPSNALRYKKNSPVYYYNGIDRVNNYIGYTESNCVACCAICNSFKADLPKELFILQINKIYTFQLTKIGE